MGITAVVEVQGFCHHLVEQQKGLSSLLDKICSICGASHDVDFQLNNVALLAVSRRRGEWRLKTVCSVVRLRGGNSASTGIEKRKKTIVCTTRRCTSGVFHVFTRCFLEVCCCCCACLLPLSHVVTTSCTAAGLHYPAAECTSRVPALLPLCTISSLLFACFPSFARQHNTESNHPSRIESPLSSKERL